jgi:hypothetical protein
MALAKNQYSRPTLLNNLKRILLLPCAETPEAYIELAVEAFVHAGLSIAEPDPKELYHKLLGEPLVHTLRSAVEDFHEALNGDKGSSVQRFFGKALGVYDRLTWWMFLFFAIDDGLFDATSNFIRMDPCLSGRGLGSGTHWIAGIHKNGVPGSALFAYPPGSDFAPVAPSAIQLGEFNNWTGTFACNCVWGSLINQPDPVTSNMYFLPNEGTPILLDTDTPVPDPQSGYLPSVKTFFHYKGVRGIDGQLITQFSYVDPAHPDDQSFLLEGTSYASYG